MSGTNTDSRSSETPPEPYEDGAKAEQPRPTTTEKKMHSSLVEQNLPKRKPERVEVGSVSCTVLQMYGPGLVTSRARCTGKAERTEGVVDDGGASSTDALPEPTPARSSSSASVPSRAAKPLGSTRPIGVRLLVVFLERSTRLDSPLRSILRSGEAVFHSSMPCVRSAADERSQDQHVPACRTPVSPQHPRVHRRVLGGAHRRGGLFQ